MKHTQIEEGKDIYFECSIQANPPANEVRWWFQGIELRTNASQGVIISGDSLVLQHVTKYIYINN